MSNYKKTLTAAIGALIAFATLVITSTPTAPTASEYLSGVIGLATALGVFAAPNEPATAPSDGGYGLVEIGVFLLLVVVALILLLRYLPA